MTETTATVKVQGGNWEVLMNEAGARLLQANLQWLGPPAYASRSRHSREQIQRATGVAEVGMSTSVKPLEGQELRAARRTSAT